MELFQQASIIMLLGMGLVFLFLAMVVLCVQGVARIARWHEGHDLAESGSPSADDGRRVAAVIAVALRGGE